MSQRPPPAKGPRKPGAAEERRADPDGRAAPGSLRHLKGLLGRPIGLERRDGHLHVVLVERRSAPRSAAPTPAQICAELRERLLAQGLDNAAQVMRHLVAVHDKLAGRGWAAVGALPARLLARAGVQVEMLIGDEPVPLLAHLHERLRLLQAAAELREERAAGPAGAAGDGAIEVSETTQEAFDEVERSWVVPPTELPSRD